MTSRRRAITWASEQSDGFFLASGPVANGEVPPGEPLRSGGGPASAATDEVGVADAAVGAAGPYAVAACGALTGGDVVGAVEGASVGDWAWAQPATSNTNKLRGNVTRPRYRAEEP